MFKRIYNALWGFRGKVFHIYYSMYRQNKALHMRFNEAEELLNTIDSKLDRLVEPPLKVEMCKVEKEPDIICRASKKRKPGRPKKKGK